ncbi:hypothetical protein [Rubrivivax gelatinosus]|uniref:Uncharacterized protein n=1 Tax=Rubrivivax gelatinosus (strain NBRC 100245 / IL144) TaxID=983917 RepID=I0HTG1_RUBGI|nr:hypothetical protein [Rubrivivax gelatinosus]BAL96298.1 hypothetical protein RGE_29590 [Rubrivivax gelatinosus IL144]
MNPLIHAGLLSLAIAAGAAAAHGDEPHGDAPHAPSPAMSTGPRFETATELFEVVGRLDDGALTLWLNRFATGEPVAGAAIELELDTLKALARYRAERGDYLVADAAFVAALATPGQHALVLTVTAGEDADLLDTTVAIAPPPAADAGAAGTPARGRLAGGALLALATAAGLVFVWRRRQSVTRERTV